MIAIGIAALGLASGLGARAQGEHVPLPAVAVLTAMGLVLVPRRRFPAAVLVAMAALVTALALLHTTLEGAFPAVLVAAYSAGVYGGRRLVACLATGAVAAILLAAALPVFGRGGAVRHAPIPAILAAAGAALVGLMIRRQFAARSAYLEVLAERAEWTAVQAAQEARRATLAERLRIARELHDIVAHHLSVIVIQAQGAQRVAGRDVGRARQAMADVERTGRTALDEMRRLLGLLRAEDGTDAGEDADGDHPAPTGLAEVGALAERMTAAGLPVAVRMTGAQRPVPEDVGLTVYRISQEALTNVLKHAGPASAEVHLDYGDDLTLTITDDGRGAAAQLSGVLPGAGRGTTGMRERVAALGGRLTAGPQPGGGFRVHAVIPSPYLPPTPAGPSSEEGGA